MSYLLDTCTFLWLVGVSSRLSPRARAICAAPDNALFLSAVSVWEIEVKVRLGRLDLEGDPRTFVPRQRQQHAVFELPFDEESALRYSSIPALHKDPFDRMLVCQALRHGFTILTPDDHIAAYPVRTEW